MPGASPKSSTRTLAKGRAEAKSDLRPAPSPTLGDFIRCTNVCSDAYPEGEAETGRGLCLEPDQWERREAWKHVGEGRGAYELVDKFERVGQGRGNYKELLVEPASWCSCKTCCICLLSYLVTMAVLCGAYYAAATWLVPSLPKPWTDPRWVALAQRAEADAQGQVTKALQAVGLQPTPRYNCGVEGVNWMHEWNIQQKQWCCVNEKQGCAPDHGYKCKDDAMHWNTTWSEGKKHFCCGWDLVACLPATTTATTTATSTTRTATTPAPTTTTSKATPSTAPPTTAAKVVVTEAATTPEPTTTSKTTEAPTTTTTTAAPYNCQGWHKEWSSEKQDYCCKTAGVGCDVSTTRVPHDCELGLDRWELDWTAEKKDWCCDHEHVGCKGQERASVVSAPAPAPATSAPTTTAAQAQWKGGCDSLCTVKDHEATCKARIAWLLKTDLAGQDLACELALGQVLSECAECTACSLVETGCETLPPSADHEYRCDVGEPSSWGVHKKRICCEKEHVGCEPPRFACFGDSQLWGEAERMWCCDHRELGCNVRKLKR